MGRYDDIDPGKLQGDLAAFARLLLRLEEEGRMLTAAAEIQRLMGDLRQKLFAYEVRRTRELGGPDSPGGPGDTGKEGAKGGGVEEERDRAVRESLRIVREALEREEEMAREWEAGEGFADDEDEDP